MTDSRDFGNESSSRFVRGNRALGGSVHVPRELRLMEMAAEEVRGTVGDQTGTATLFFRFRTTRPGSVSLALLPVDPFTDRFLQIGLLDSDRRSIPLDAGGAALERLPPGSYTVTLASSSWHSTRYRFELQVEEAMTRFYWGKQNGDTLYGDEAWVDSDTQIPTTRSITQRFTALGTPVNGTVTDASVAANANIASSKLAHNAAGSGAVARTIQSKLRDALNARDFGALGDGIADDTAALQAAATAAVAQGKVLFIPRTSAFYRVPNGAISVTLADNTGLIIASDGAELRVTSPVGGVIILALTTSAVTAAPGTNTYLEVYGLVLDGRGVPEQWAETNPANIRIVTGIGSNAEAVRVHNCRFNQLFGYGISCAGALFTSFVDNRLTRVGGRWYLGDANESYGDAFYHRQVKPNANLLISNCSATGYPGNYSRIGVTYEFSNATSYKARIEHCRFDGYSRAIHIEENSSIDLTIDNCVCVNFWVGVFSLGTLNAARLRILNSFLQYGAGTYNSSAGWTANGSDLPTEIRNSHLTITSAGFTANGGTNHQYSNTSFDYKNTISILSNHIATFTDCSFLNIVDQAASYYFFNGTQRFRGCTFSGAANANFGMNSGTPFAEVSNCVSFGPLLKAAQAQGNRYEGFTPSSNLLSAGFRSNNGTTIYGPSRYNTFPDSDFWIGEGSANTAGGLSFTASATTVPSPIWRNLSKATLIAKFSDGSAPYLFTQSCFGDPTQFGCGFYVADIRRNTAGNWVADGSVVTKGDPAAAGFQGTTADSLTWTATGSFANVCQAIIVPRHCNTYLN